MKIRVKTRRNAANGQINISLPKKLFKIIPTDITLVVPNKMLKEKKLW